MRINQLFGLALLGASLTVELFTHLLRFSLYAILVLMIRGESASVTWYDIVVLTWPVIAVVATLTGWPGGALMRWEYGARRPSAREQEVLAAAMARLDRGSMRLPRRWYVIDAPVINASAVGSTLFVTRGLIDSPHLDGVVAHELGHVNSLDGRLTLAVERIPFPGLAWIVRRLEDAGATRPALVVQLALAGGYGRRVWPLSALWQWYWRRREYAADRFAANLGASDDLIGYLEDYPRAMDTATPFMRGMTHPYVEHRLDRLMRRGASAIGM